MPGKIPKILGYVVLALVALGIWIAIAYTGGGSADDAIKRGLSIAGFSMCNETGVVSFEELTNIIKRVYYECASNGKCKTEVCQEVTLDIPACYKVNRDVLDSYGLSQFTSLPLCLSLSNAFELKCGSKGGPNFDTIVYKGETGDNYCKLKSAPFCNQVGDYFSLGMGAVIDVSAEKKGMLWKSTDVKLKIKGGTGYGSCVTAPLKFVPACTGDGDCNVAPKPSWGWCDIVKNKCRYDHYCENRDPGGTGMCRKVTASCAFGDVCVPEAPSTSLEAKCTPTRPKATVDELIWPGTPAIQLTYSESGLPQRIAPGDEKCYAYNNAFGLYHRPVQCSDKDARISLAYKANPANPPKYLTVDPFDPSRYLVEFYLGCY